MTTDKSVSVCLTGVKKKKNVMLHSRNLVHRDDDGRQELVGDGLHVLDGGLQPGSHLLVGHRLLWSHVIGQLAVDDITEETKKKKRKSWTRMTDGEKEEPSVVFMTSANLLPQQFTVVSP